jgi:CRP-like cAMP-binding protein
MVETEAGMDRGLIKLRVRDEISAEEERVLRAAVTEVRELPAGKVLVPAGKMLGHSTLLLDGLTCRYKDLRDGQRQILELHVAGDFLDLHSFLLKKLDHNVGSMTPVRIGLVPHDALRAISEEQPHLARLLWLSTLLDAAVHRERLLSVGRRDAMARIAHLLCELYVRMELVGLAADHRYMLPLTQTDLADANGLTSVHVNRMLKRLRDDGVMTFRNGEVVIHDWKEMTRRAEFDVAYLHLEKRAL